MVNTSRIQARCPYCGDSEKHPDKKHLTIYIDSLSFYCFRCGTHGELSLRDAMALLSLVPSDGSERFAGVTLPLGSTADHLEPSGSHSAAIMTPPKDWSSILDPDSRFSMVDRRWQSGGYDIFEMKNKAGGLTGFHLRNRSVKKAYTIGQVGFGYADSRLSPRKVWKVVEGPYDTLDTDFVCTFGVPTESLVRNLGLLDLILVPDGDIWNRDDLFIRWFRPFINLKVAFQEVWKIGDGKDIDEAESIQRLAPGSVKARYFGLLKASQGRHDYASAKGNGLTLNLSAG